MPERIPEIGVAVSLPRVRDIGHVMPLVLRSMILPWALLVTALQPDPGAPPGEPGARVVRHVEYAGIEALLGGPAIVYGRLVAAGISLAEGSAYDAGQARRAAQVIRDALRSEGYLDAEVTLDAAPAGSQAVDLRFETSLGPRALLRSVDFTGNHSFSDGALRDAMISRSYGLLERLGFRARHAYSPERWAADRRALTSFYADRGFALATIGDPRVSFESGRVGFHGTPVRWAELHVTVDEGPRFRMGTMRFTGLSLFPEADVRNLFEVRPGEIFREAALLEGLARLTERYGRRGHVRFQGDFERTRRDNGVLDVEMRIEEGPVHFVGRVEFRGARRTKLDVLRRNVVLVEGNVLDTERLAESMRRLDRLPFLRPSSRFRLVPAAAVENVVDVVFLLRERDPSAFDVSGGASGREGAWLGLSLSAVNLHGSGRSGSLEVRGGGRLQAADLRVSDPQFLGMPLSASLAPHYYRVEFPSDRASGQPGYTDQRSGFDLAVLHQADIRSRLAAAFTLEAVRISPLGTDEPAGPVDFAVRTQSRLRLEATYDDIGELWPPGAGVRLTSTLSLTGGPLGGDSDFLGPAMEAVASLPAGREAVLGFHARWAAIVPAGPKRRPAGSPPAVPFDERILLGGEQQLRGFAARSVGPRDAEGRLQGADRAWLANVEYVRRLAGPLRAVLFLDFGRAYQEGKDRPGADIRGSVGLELRVALSSWKIPLRLIGAWNPWRDGVHPRSRFAVALAPTF